MARGDKYQLSSNSPAAIAALRHRVRTGRYRVTPAQIAAHMLKDITRGQRTFSRRF